MPQKPTSFVASCCIPILSSLLATSLVAVAGEPSAENSAAEGIVPIPDYSADLWDRTYLLGELDGSRNRLAAKGVQYELQWTQTLQGIVDGGLDQTTRYGGAVDLGLTFDLQRLGLVPGALLYIRAESRYGHSVNSGTGQILPANTDAFFPITDEADGQTVSITNFLYQQYLSDSFGFFLGKFDNLESDFNEFASGRGTSQFMNANMAMNAATILSPYSSLGAFVFWAPKEHIFVWGGAYNSSDSSSTTGFDDFDEGTSIFGEFYYQYNYRDLPGGFLVGGVFDVNNDFINLNDTRLVEGPIPVPNIQKEDKAWVLYANAWQYLWTAEPAGDTLIDTQNHETDLAGIGLFLRAGTADEDVNPVKWSVSVGLGGKGIIPGRQDDSFGAGYFHTRLRDNNLKNALRLEDESQGFEVYYNVALTPASQLSLDCQVLDSPIENVDTAVVLGMRLHTTF